MSFQDKIVIVTGATSGIGKATALSFAAAGAKVVGCGRNQKRLNELEGKIDLALSLDVTRPESVAVAEAAVMDRYGKVDVLVNNAGIGLFKSLEETSEEQLQQVMAVNFFGAVRVAKAFAPLLLASKGVLVQLSSVAGKRGYAKHTAYCASKHALNGWSEALRADWKGTGASVVVVCPPAIATPFFENAGYMTFDADHKGLKLMTAEEVAAGILEATRLRKREVILSARARVLYGLSVVAPGLLEQVQKFK
jgi:NAD(P)-dependent dehydrogenase (short-subunit alcohol dehydrogenase family)